MGERSLQTAEKAPQIGLTSPPFQNPTTAQTTSHRNREGAQTSSWRSHTRRRNSKHVHIDEAVSSPDHHGSSIYLGSYRNTPQRSQGSIGGSVNGYPQGSATPSPRASMGHLQLEYLLASIDTEMDTYGLDELRDGFFDASFYRPLDRDRATMTRRASETLPLSLMYQQHLSLSQSCIQQALLLIIMIRTIVTSRAGIKLVKSFLGVFLCYILSLIPTTKAWLGKYSYIATISAIINHPGRSVGSQIDGAILTTMGTLVGLLWGGLAQYASSFDFSNSAGRGGVLAVFLVLYTAFFGWLRCSYLRFYQANLAAGIAICYACLINAPPVSFRGRLTDYIIPWEIGQAIALVVCSFGFPAAGTRPLCKPIRYF